MKAAVIPSGLASNWKSKLSAAAPHRMPSKGKGSCQAPSEIAYPLGGLEDEDAFADVTGTLELSKEHPTASQKNDVCCFCV